MEPGFLTNLNSLETLLTSVLTTLGVASPLVFKAVSFAFKQYQDIRKAVDFVLALDSRLDEMDLRLKKAGVSDADEVVTRQIRALKGSLKESFHRRDMRLDSVETRVERVVEQARQTAVVSAAAAAPAPIVKLPETVSGLTTKLQRAEQRLTILEGMTKDHDRRIETLIDLKPAPIAEVRVQAPAADTTAVEQKVKAVALETTILKRALLKLAAKMRVDLSFELHEAKATKAPEARTIDYKQTSLDRAKKIAQNVQETEPPSLEDVMKQLEEE